MASSQQPEVQLAQRLASNEKPVRTRALRKLKKYISAREGTAGGFSAEELLKLWKGLFYCLWMQDKPLLQEELSSQISNLVHSFPHTDKQLLFLQSFLQTMKREWTGIDRLRMDKFFQLIRFMFRQSFEVLKRNSWDSRAVTGFLELLGSQLLQSDSETPAGLQLHILELYLTELAAVGSAELTAEQNLTFIDPFCRTVAKTKNQMLFSAICRSIFSTIIDQAPFAVEDLMREVGQAEESDPKDGEEGPKTRRGGDRGKIVNGKDSSDAEEEEEDLLPLDLESQLSGDEDIGPVLQFDYAAVADRLMALAGRGSTPGQNRRKLYRIVKVLKDLSEGVFPQDEYPEEVSTDEDDDMFGSRKRMKRAARLGRGEEEPAAGQKKASKSGSDVTKQQNQNNEPAEAVVKKKKRRRKEVLGDEVNSEDQTAADVKTTEERLQRAADPSEGPEETPELKAAEEELSTAVQKDQPKRKKSTKAELQELQQTSAPAETENGGSLMKKKRKRRRKSKVLGVEAEDASEPPESKDEAPAEITNKAKKTKPRAGPPVNGSPASVRAEGGVESSVVGPKRRKVSSTRMKKSPRAEEADQQETGGPEVSAGALQQPEATGDEQKSGANVDPKPLESPEPGPVSPLKKRKKRKVSAAEQARGDAESLQAGDEKTPEVTMATAAKKKKMNGPHSQISEETRLTTEPPSVDCQEKVKKRRRKKIPVEFEFEADELKEAAEGKMDAKKLQQVKGAADPASPLKTKAGPGLESDFVSFQTRTVVPKPLFCKTRVGQVTPHSKKKKKPTPRSELKKVTFGLKNNQTAEFRRSDRSLLLSPEGSSRVPFDPEQKPKFGVLKTPPTTPITAKKRSKTKTSKTAKGPGKRRPLASDFF
uniref:Ribosomal RNA processing 1 n=1 Tax=Oryzias latipes TaxID=8090 RepID=A0A3P9KDC8_ORYLA